jgi:hypothetical protein
MSIRRQYIYLYDCLNSHLHERHAAYLNKHYLITCPVNFKRIKQGKAIPATGRGGP